MLTKAEREKRNQTIASYYANNHYTCYELAEKYELGYSTIRGILKQAGVEIKMRRGTKSGKYGLAVKARRMGKKYCPRCGEILDLGAFAKNQAYCRECRSALSRNRSIWKRRAESLNKRAGRKYVKPNDIYTVWKNQQGKCYYCQTELDKDNDPRNVTIDHVVNGWDAKDNLVIACRQCNWRKSNAAFHEIVNIAIGMWNHPFYQQVNRLGAFLRGDLKWEGNEKNERNSSGSAR